MAKRLPIQKYSEEYWAFFERPPRPPSSGDKDKTVPPKVSKRQKELKELNKYSSVMEHPHATLHRAKLPTSLPGSLFRRELGSPSTELVMKRFQSHVLRQLHAARAPKNSSEEGVEHNISNTLKRGQLIQADKSPKISDSPIAKKMKWTKISSTGSTSGISKYKFTFLDDMIMIKEGILNTRRFLLHNPPIFPGSSPYTIQYSIVDEDKTKMKWRSHELSLIDNHNPQMNNFMGIQKVAKIPNSLLVLESSGKLSRYNLNDGRKIEELDLTYPGGPLYSQLLVDHNVSEKAIFVIANISSVKKSHPGMVLELLIITSYPKLRVCHRLLFPKGGGFGAVDDINIQGDLLSIIRSNSVEFFNLQQVLDANSSETCDKTTGIHERMILANKPQSLGLFKSKAGFVCIVETAHPPTICVKANDVYEVRCLDNPGVVIEEIGYKTHEEDVNLLSYDSDRPRLAVSGLPHGFDIYHVETDRRRLKLIYSTRDFEEQESSLLQRHRNSSSSSSTDSTLKRAGLRQLIKKNYADQERVKCFGFGLENNLQLLAVCMVVDGTLKTTILNNETLKPLRKLSAVNLFAKKGKSAQLGCSNIVVQFNETHISVQLSLFDPEKSGGNFERVYTANLIGEEAQMS